MVKAATLWLRGLARIGKAQQRSASKLVKVLLAQPKAKARAKPKPPLTARSSRAARLPAPLPGKWLAFDYAPASQGLLATQRMLYWLYLPAKAPPQAVRSKGLPLIVMLHGCEQSATQFAQGTGMNRLAEQKSYAVLYPQQSLNSHAHRCWKWYDKATQDGGGDVHTIVGIIEQVATAYRIDRSRIYICGMSAGAGMANIVALHHPELIAALGLHSAPVFGAGHHAMGALSVMQHGASGRAEGAISEILASHPSFPPMPTILIQGESDRVVRPINQTHLVRQSVLLNRMPVETAVSLAVKPAGRAGSRNPANAHHIHDFLIGKKLLLRVAQIEHLDHAWSGGDPSLPFNAKAGPNASKMMLDFFARHRRAG